jgi:hypothetical protein
VTTTTDTCTYCGKQGHWRPDCPELRPVRRYRLTPADRQAGRKMSNPSEAIPYRDFRTGYTWQEVRDMIWGLDGDPSTWPLAHHTRRRHTVLGKWRQLKLEMYNDYLQGFREHDDLPF